MFMKHRLFGMTVIGCALSFAPAALTAQAPDNSAQNKGQQTTADQQSHSASDRETTRKIRQSIMADKSLSTYGHNVKVICQNGSVELKGPVHSDDESKAIFAHATDVAGPDRVTNHLTVKQ